MPETLKVIQVGLGPIGLGVTRYLLEKSFLRLVGALDINPAIRGEDVGTLAGLPREAGVRVSDDLAHAFAAGPADLVFLTTGSSLAKVKPQILELLERGANVVSTCEELSYPWLTQPAAAAEIDARARTKGVSVLGTGVNPGFLMDFLPLVTTAVCRSVERIVVERIQDAGRRRIPFQKKIGAGLAVADFRRLVGEKVIRHVGLTESMHLLAASLGWKPERTEDIIEPIVDPRDGRVARGVSQVGRTFCEGREVITLIFRASLGEPESYDRIRVHGEPEIDLKIAGGVNGDTATCAIAVNAAPQVVAARPGLRTMADLEPVFYRRSTIRSR